METPELFINPNMMPIYITSTNMVTPLIPNHLMTNPFIFKFNSLYTNTLMLFDMIMNIIRICIQTAVFIIKEIFVEAFSKMTVVKMVYIIGIYNLFMLAVLDNQQRKIAKQEEKIESLEKELRHLKKADKVRDEFEQLWIHDIKSYNQETTKKMISIEKKIKKIEKEFK
jgi:hypothetical protein